MATIEELERKLLEAESKNQQLDERAKRFEGQVADMQKKLDVFSGVDLEKLRAAAEENEILKRQSQGFDEEKFQEAVEAKLQKDREAWQGKLSEAEKIKAELESKLHEHEVVGAAYSIIGGKLKDDMAPFIKDILRKSLKKEGDAIIAFEGDQKLYSKQDVSKPMGVGEFCGIISEKYPSAFRETVPAGNMNKGERMPANSGGDIVGKLRDPELAKSLTQKEKLEAGLKLASQYRRL